MVNNFLELIDEYKIIITIIILMFVWSAISSLVTRYLQSVRDKAAHEVLDDSFDFNKERSEILAVYQEVYSNRGKEEACPACNGILVPRRGQYGPFTGCTNYPDCHYTRY